MRMMKVQKFSVFALVLNRTCKTDCQQQKEKKGCVKRNNMYKSNQIHHDLNHSIHASEKETEFPAILI